MPLNQITFDNQYFLDLDLMVKYAEHFWAIITKSLVVICLIFGAVFPYLTKLYNTVKTRFYPESLDGSKEK
jgi:hypothetical protein